MTYDEKCLDLAQHFLADEPGTDPLDAAELAQAIQTMIEDWLLYTLRGRHAEGRV